MSGITPICRALERVGSHHHHQHVRRSGRVGRRVRRFVATIAAGGLVATALATAVPAAQADTAPAAGRRPRSAPTRCRPGRSTGWCGARSLVGNTVYATGSFTKARPPGVAAGGAGEIDARNIFAYDITTGNRVATSATR